MGAETNAGGPPTPAALIALLGRHPLRSLGGVPSADDDPALARWWLAAFLLGMRSDEAAALAGARSLGSLEAVAAADPAPLARQLAELEIAHAEEAAVRLVRGARALAARHAGSLAALLAEAESLEALGGALAALAPGFGSAGVRRFLAPLRGEIAAAADVPLAPAAQSALACLGWLAPEADPEAALDVLHHRAREAGGDALDLEAALERLGARACRRARVRRCPLGAACPRVAGPEPRD